jgi:hypothetical protein
MICTKIQKYLSFVLVVICLLSAYSCRNLKRGFVDANTQFVPKNPKFKLQDRATHNLPTDLDITNVYRLNKIIVGGYEVPFPDSSVFVYQQFYADGRCLEFGVSSTDTLGQPNLLTYEMLNPNNPNYKKSYYYSQGGNVFRVENFQRRKRKGKYVINKYFVSDKGKSINMMRDNVKYIFEVEILPEDWGRYAVDW